MWQFLSVGLGGFLGAAARYGVSRLPLKGGGFPTTTLLVNVAGALLIGMLVAWAGKDGRLSPGWLLFLQTGFCGGFTAFSTFSLEAVRLFQTGRTSLALLYMAVSLLLCLAGVVAGQMLVK